MDTVTSTITEQELQAMLYDKYGNAKFGSWLVHQGLDEDGVVTYYFQHCTLPVSSIVFRSTWAFCMVFNWHIQKFGLI